MIGVKFTRAVRPYGAGDTAMLPEDAAQAVVDSGEAELYQFPSDPHAHEAGYKPPVTKPMKPGGGRQGYRTKEGQ
jgi:hypothetical protein